MRLASPAFPHRVNGLAWAVVLAAMMLSGCGSSSSSSSRTSTPLSHAATGHGSVNVLYAGSLEDVMNKSVGPAFTKATGYSFNGFPAGSKDLASEIKGKVRQGDVFLSASPKVNATLEGASNGDWVSWYAPFATTSLVLGYNPSASSATAIKQVPWYRVISRPGLRIGTTDPKLDPKGELTVAALDEAATRLHQPALRKVASDQSNYFPEQDLVGRLQAGQLDAGFFYTVEANAAKIPTVSLAPISEKAEYTITVLKRAPDQAGAVAFVKFLLSPQGRTLLTKVGLVVTSSPRATGTSVPAGLDQVVKPPS